MRSTLSRFLRASATALRFHLERYLRLWVTLALLATLLSVGYAYTLAAPQPFPADTIVVILGGATGTETAATLKRAGLVEDAAAFGLLLRLTGASAHIHPGAYRFTHPENAFAIAKRLVSGAFGIPPIRITFTEGETVRDMASDVNAAFPEITASAFIAAAGPYEGYLFPDTYLFPPDATAASITAAMKKEFEDQIAPLSSAIVASGHSLSDIVIMASLVEKEARSREAKGMVSGILWNRIARGMLLQVDAVFGYIYGRDTYSPSLKDLGVDSPYNTYTHTGLPPGPIDNPGLVSLTAATEPTKSAYLFYLTGRDGQMHYATTYAGQLQNQRLYLQ